MRNIFLILTALMLSIFYSCNKDKKALSLPAIFSDNLVLQQNTEAAVWGKATAGSKIILKSSWGEIVKTRATKEGRWTAKIRTPVAGGPYELEISNKDSVINIKNVMIG